ncbi:alpha/beta hydrolase-fold protein [Pontibacter sp. G13]|uniref:alpha/beta hydrolase n=1 Tax=Pontibacter sp. G13 TaxID=3074898 RepID=UPI00288B6744|nr:alpha/beta hydrolase-fold protein [Pontibacter sp. G13]WNJ18364.1 alpha/beta hydrolase-fold protein [Pontibacter sp. G13]
MSAFRTIEISDSAYELGGLRFLTIKSPNLKGRGDVCVWVPANTPTDQPLPVYLLLHGVYGSAWIWAMKGGAHTTAQRMMQSGEIQPAIIAMPSDGLWGDGSAYAAHNGYDYGKWIVEDVPKALAEQLEQVDETSPICIGGLSMGGYGALSLGLRYADRIAGISGHSSITRFEEMKLFVEEPLNEYAMPETPMDVIQWLDQAKGTIPPLRFDCGVIDELIEGNRLLHQQLIERNIPHEYTEFQGGHEWPYWQEHVAKTYRWFDRCLAGELPRIDPATRSTSA